MARVVTDLDVDLESIIESYLHDLEVPLEKSDLLPHRYHWLVTALQCVTQKLTQSGDHASHAARIPLNQGRHRVQRIEEKVRIELGIERGELRFRELGFELCRLTLESGGLTLA